MDFIQLYKNCVENQDKEEASKELYGGISILVNCFGFRPNETLESICADEDLHGSFLKLSAYWIVALCMMQEKKFLIDGRNEYSAKTAAKLACIREFQLFLKGQVGDLADARKSLERTPRGDACMELLTVHKMLTQHRTLQQTFSGMVFSFLKSELPEINEKMESEWERCPFI